MRAALGFVLATFLLGACGGSASVRRPDRVRVAAARPTPAVERASRPRALAPAPTMETRGLTGSLTTVEVNRALTPRAEELGMCFARHGRRLRTLGGRIQLAFHVGADGRVLSVHATDSTIGHRQVERCIVEVAAATRFPRPQGGGEADFTWPLELDPPEDVRHPDTWDPSRVARVVRHEGRRVLERCLEDEADASFQVTTYVSRSGRVIAAGAIAFEPVADEPLDCVARLVRRWRMPRPDRHQAKVTFELR